MVWEIIGTDSFLKNLKKHKKDSELLKALENKIKRLRIDPLKVGGRLHGELHPSRSTRLIKKFRLIFLADEKGKKVYLEAIDHRKDAY